MRVTLLRLSVIFVLLQGTLILPALSIQVARYDVCPQGCTYQSIQAAIDDSKEGALLLVGSGTYRENVQITKSITLLGAGPDLVLLQPTPTADEAFRIKAGGDQRLRVMIAQLSTQAGFGFLIRGPVDVTIQGVRFSPPREIPVAGFGVQVEGAASVTLIDTVITTAGAGIGVSAEGTGPLFLSHVELMKNAFGIELGSSVQVGIFDSMIVDSRFIGIGGGGGSGHVSISRSQIINAEVGISVSGQSRFFIQDSVISGNKRSGIEVSRSGRLTLLRTTVSGNGSKDETVGFFGGGVLIGLPIEKSNIVIESSRLTGNLGWGVGAFNKECFPEIPNIVETGIGQVSGGKNQIPDKNEPEANLRGDVCPAGLKFLKTEQGGRYSGP